MVAEKHVNAISHLPGIRLTGVHDADQALTAQRSVEWSVTGYINVEALLVSGNVDAVIVSTPENTHVDISLAALRAGKHVLIEKPVADDPADITRIADLARERSLVAIPGHNYIYLPEARRAVDAVRSGLLGASRVAFINYAIAHQEVFASRYGDVLTEVMVHHAYLAVSCFGVPRTIYAGQAASAWASLRTSDQAWMTWVYDRPAAPTLTVQMIATFGADDWSDSPQTFAMKVLGSSGTTAFNWRTTTGRPSSGPFSTELLLYDESFVHQMEAFRDAIRGESDRILSTLDQAAQVAALMEIAVTSASSQSVQLVPTSLITEDD